MKLFKFIEKFPVIDFLPLVFCFWQFFIAREIAAGAESVGAAVESIFLQGMDIKACRACWTCQKPDSDGCAIKDDM